LGPVASNDPLLKKNGHYNHRECDAELTKACERITNKVIPAQHCESELGYGYKNVRDGKFLVKLWFKEAEQENENLKNHLSHKDGTFQIQPGVVPGRNDTRVIAPIIRKEIANSQTKGTEKWIQVIEVKKKKTESGKPHYRDMSPLRHVSTCLGQAHAAYCRGKMTDLLWTLWR
ncbi:hypothetical protein DERF_014263, partial [Dermatophagoides farinae]